MGLKLYGPMDLKKIAPKPSAPAEGSFTVKGDMSFPLSGVQGVKVADEPQKQFDAVKSINGK